MTLTLANPSLPEALDERQRDMLEAMGIKLWMPKASEPTASLPAPRPARAAIQSTRVEAAAHPAPPSSPTHTARANAELGVAQVLKTQGATPSQAVSAHPVDLQGMGWQALQQAVTTCEACTLCKARKNAVFGFGPTAANLADAPHVDWLIVGDPPDADEDREGQPFAGQAGKLLDNMLAAMKIAPAQPGKPVGLSRNKSAYLTNIVKCRPPASRNPHADELATCAPYLARQIELLQPKLIIAMGRFAIQSLIGSSEPVGKLRGRIHRFNLANLAVPVIVTYHPTYLLSHSQAKAAAWADLLLAMQTFSSPPEQETGKA